MRSTSGEVIGPTEPSVASTTLRMACPSDWTPTVMDIKSRLFAGERRGWSKPPLLKKLGPTPSCRIGTGRRAKRVAPFVLPAPSVHLTFRTPCLSNRSRAAVTVARRRQEHV